MNAVAVAGQMLVLIGIFYVPGFLALFGLRLKVFPALALAPAASAAIAGAASMVCLATGWRWSPASAAALAAAAVALCFVAGRRAVRLSVRQTARRKVPAALPAAEADGGKAGGSNADEAASGAAGQEAIPLYLKVLLGATLAVAAGLIGTAMVRGMVSLDRVNQSWDATFHVNAVRWIQDGGQSSPWSISPIFGNGPPSFYPAGWHELVSLVPGDVVTAANLACLLIGGVIWPVSLAYLAAALFPRLPVVLVLAPLFGAAVLAFPFIQLVRSAQWPNGFATAVIPAILALGINLLYASRLSWHRRPQDAVQAPAPGTGARCAALLLAAAGAVWIHPSAFFALLLLGGFYLGRFLILGFLYQWRLSRIRAAVVSVLSLAVLAAAAAGLSRLSVLVRVLDYPRRPYAGWRGSLVWLYFDLPTRPAGHSATPQTYAYVLAALMLAGAAIALAYNRSRPAVGGMAAATGMFMLAAGPDNPFRWLAGFWYKDPTRIAPLVLTFGCVFAALAAERVCRLPARALRRAGERQRQVLTAVLGLAAVALVFASSGGFRYETKVASVATPYQVTPMPRGRALLGHEQDFIRSLGPLLPKDAVVIGDPFNGLPYIYALTGHRVVFPQMINRPTTADEAYLRQHFRHIRTDPKVCIALIRLRAGYVYDDGPIRARQTDRGLKWPGFTKVDYTHGFDLVARHGTAALYRITACRRL
ncbi:hypothetical protein LVY72_22520 [Arthrobacter sp. I2-34]|uniref:Uncharacterized protein n=1 Tax=Arthrobacter hankyongi TaxID=2904801 RepID=A0ABS9LDB0_9MICC|nr:DUF6541 family protein [Arthrobacter hankyongi]MCG2624668.1 hypothetical protein [Arthrobacter hankyongi]